ncbi:MAG: uroporphyrinogen-III C-methyltransferase [Streptosporangiales bacterium]|nr:uroporphyrinogen-III C-methyltransferase [Streptosporangiales bacterium]
MSTAERYPLFLDIAGKAALVVGGGPVASRRAAALADAGADVTVVAPWASDQIRADGRLRWLRRPYRTTDLDGVWLVHAATNDPTVNAQVAAEADERRVWCVRADDGTHSAAWTPAVARVDDVTVAVTAGRDPRTTVAIRDAIRTRVATDLECGTLPIRRHRKRAQGHVTLVGGGPGDPGLITTRGRRALADADVVVVDRLAPRALLAGLDEDVEVVDVGKAPGRQPVPQQEINDILVERARAGRHVVRLKGGDPFVFGRGGEELLACRAADVSVTVVPGVSSAFAAPAAAHVPVTHRGLSRAVTVASAHDELDWPALARLDSTLVLLMGVSTLEQTTRRLLDSGLAADTPVTVVERAFYDDQRTTSATLATIAAVARERAVSNPAVVVIGAVAGLVASSLPELPELRTVS